MTLDIGRETAEFGNALKAALVGISALAEHYEVIVRADSCCTQLI